MNYNLWKVISDKIIISNGVKFLKCQCQCGTIRDVRLKNLKSGISKNCGCVRNKKTRDRNLIHNKRGDKVWSVWQDMKSRCYNSNNKGYKNYGGRGITVCDEWIDNFINFYKVVGDVPMGKTLDRIDNNGNYTPKNVHWATKQEQNSNKRSNRKINGICITYIDKILGGSPSLISKRLKRGWTLEKAITLKSNAISYSKN